MRLTGNSKVLIGRTIGISAMAFYFTVSFIIYDYRAHRMVLFAIWSVFVIIGQIVILFGKRQERKEKLQADPTGRVSFQTN
jgi:hypothetical protein